MGKHNMQEIERKFLVRDQRFKSQASKQINIVQGYLNSDPERTVRIRISDDKAFITIKGIPDDGGTTRFEWEREIVKSEAEALLELCEKGVIRKTRFLINAGPHTYEVDEFYGDNLGLVVAEIELENAAQDYMKTEWLGEEVTGDKKYYNSQLSTRPYNQWVKAK